MEKFFRKRKAEVLKAMTIDMTFERREGLIRAEERSIGDKTRLISQVQKKIQKGKSLETVADELESTVDEIRPIYDAVQKFPAGTEAEKIYEELLKPE